MNDLTTSRDRLERELKQLRNHRRDIVLFFFAMAIFFIGLALIGK